MTKRLNVFRGENVNYQECFTLAVRKLLSLINIFSTSVLSWILIIVKIFGICRTNEVKFN
ncbi:hypothetical protein XA3_19890 [Xylocopilactobacillus apicola]|uniref:Uncharacterized protein n=1 Tax=Xylocopilactobacillus apicola TaxID=2932184 RepID=A0AAU9D7M4_9LACO|nr:hypothetical protein XA3_19890 [Xylocopilactobacillus apicola]